MGVGGDDLEGLGGRNEGLAFEGAADDVDQGVGQVGEVAQGLVAHVGAVAIAAAQEMGLVDLAIVVAGRSDDVNGA